MTLTHNGIQYAVWWKHTNNTGVTNISKKRPAPSYSFCTIAIKDLSVEDPTAIAYIEGGCTTHPSDMFNRKLGKKISFKRAVAQISNKEVRTLLWKKFNTKTVISMLVENESLTMKDFLEAFGDKIISDKGTTYIINGMYFVLASKEQEQEKQEVVHDNS